MLKIQPCGPIQKRQMCTLNGRLFNVNIVKVHLTHVKKKKKCCRETSSSYLFIFLHLHILSGPREVPIFLSRNSISNSRDFFPSNPSRLRPFIFDVHIDTLNKSSLSSLPNFITWHSGVDCPDIIDLLPKCKSLDFTLIMRAVTCA